MLAACILHLDFLDYSFLPLYIHTIPDGILSGLAACSWWFSSSPVGIQFILQACSVPSFISSGLPSSWYLQAFPSGLPLSWPLPLPLPFRPFPWGVGKYHGLSVGLVILFRPQNCLKTQASRLAAFLFYQAAVFSHSWEAATRLSLTFLYLNTRCVLCQ